MAKKTETKTEKLEREYIIPLRKKGRAVPCYKKTPKAIKTIKEFLMKHMKIRDRDLSKIKIDKYLNEQMWFRGIKKPPVKIKVKAVKQGDVVRVELVDYPDKLKFKKLREEKLSKAAEEVGKKKKQEKAEKVSEAKVEKPDEEKKKEEKEKTSAVAEAGKQRGKAAAKQIKHEVGGMKKQKTQPVRKALEK
ncbi:60S ribosomal protein L31 [Candidatus Pacearchaeota archaeon]|nr:60S ribosomal protein L31 [Candidatus Pacearchaeota archaeon]